MEVWRDIPGYEGRYQASTLGRIKSLKREVRCAYGATRQVSERILRPGRFCKSGHLSVVLGKGATGSPVHQLIMRTFVGPTPKGQEVLHNNGDPTDNRLENLRYGNRTENILDVFAIGKAWRKLSSVDVDEIRDFLSRGHSGISLAKRYGVSEACISAVKNGRTFAWKL